MSFTPDTELVLKKSLIPEKISQFKTIEEELGKLATSSDGVAPLCFTSQQTESKGPSERAMKHYGSTLKETLLEMQTLARLTHEYLQYHYDLIMEVETR